MRIEVIGPDFFAEHDVIVEINEFVGQTGNFVQMTLNGWRGEARQVALVLENLLLEVR